MAGYKFEKKLRSYSVNRRLLKDVELFLLEKAKELAEEKFKPDDYSVQIEDSLGTQTMSSIDEYQYSQFPNDTKTINLHYLSYRADVDLRLRLSISPYRSIFAAEFSGKAPRQRVLGIWAELGHLLAPYRNKNYLVAASPFGRRLSGRNCVCTIEGHKI
jgi:hypothetical protein